MAGIELPSRGGGGGGRRRGAVAPTVENVPTARIARDPGVRASAGAFGADAAQGMVGAGQSVSGAVDQFADVSVALAKKKRDAAVASSTALAGSNLQNFALDLESDPDWETYGERFEKYSQEVFEIQSEGMDPAGKQRFQERFDLLKLENAYRVRRLSTARAADAGVADLNTALDGYASLAGRAGTPEEYDLALAMVSEDVGRAVEDGFITETAGSKAIRDWLEKADDVAARQMILDDLDGAVGALSDPDTFPNLDEGRRLSLLKEAKTQVRIEENERKREAAEQRAILRGRVNSGIRDEIESLRRTGSRAGVVSDDLIRSAYADDPERAAAMLSELDAEREFYSTRQEIALTPLSEDLAIIEANRPSGAGFAAEAERQDTLVAAAKAKRDALAKDPAGYIFQASPAIAQVFEAAEAPADMRAAITTMLDEQERLGLPRYARRALSDGQAGQLVAQYGGQQDAQGRADWVRAQAEAYGEHWPKVYEEMVGSGLPGGAIVLAGMTAPGQTRAAVALAEAQAEGAKALKDAIGNEAAGEVEDAVRVALTDFDATMAGTPGGGQIANLYRDNVTVLAMAYERAGSSPSEAADRAAADVVNSRYSFHGTYRVPVEHDGNEVERRASFFRTSRLETLDIEVPPSLDERLADDDRREQYLSAIADKGYWLTNHDETGLILMDEQGRTVLTSGGEPVEILFGEIGRLPDSSAPFNELSVSP